MKNTNLVSDYVTVAETVALAKSRPYAFEGNKVSHSYAFGYFFSTMKSTLDALNLTPEQEKVLEVRMSWLLEQTEN